MSTNSYSRLKQTIYPLVVLVLMVVACVSPATAEVIRSFNDDIVLQKDCSFDVTETIKMDFGSTYRHGIKRWIPIRFQRNLGNYTVDLKMISVTDENNAPYQYEVSNQGDEINIRIGDPNSTINGMHIYRVHYRVKHAINFFENQPELYWNVTGNESPFYIQRVTARLQPPVGVQVSDIRSECYVGAQGSTQHGTVTQGEKGIVFSAKNLAPGEGLTIVARLPVGAVVKPSAWQELLWFWQDWWPLMVLPAATSGILLAAWWPIAHNRDSDKAVSVEWNPPKDMTPAEAGTLLDGSCDITDIVSTIIDLAARGFFKIKEIDTHDKFLFLSNKDYEFTKTQPPEGAEAKLLPHERIFMLKFFGLEAVSKYSKDFVPPPATCKLSDLKHNFYLDLPRISDSIYNRMIEMKYFYKRPDQVRSSFQAISGLLIILGVGLFFVSQVAIAGGLLLSGIIVLLCAGAMPARTSNGFEKLHELLSFQRFVQMAEKKRIEVLAKDDPTIFGRLLPFAMVLGVADQWAGAFHDLLTQPPDWYVPSGYGPNYVFYPNTFVRDLGSAANSMGATLGSGPPPTSSDAGAGGGFSGFGGGGFSGGGFGGGGTGSW